MRLIVARCEVRYSGRLSAVLPEALRLIMIKSDGSVMVHADTGGYKPQNWMTPPTVIEESQGATCLVLELVEGATLQGPLPIPKVLDYARQIAEGGNARAPQGGPV